MNKHRLFTGIDINWLVWLGCLLAHCDTQMGTTDIKRQTDTTKYSQIRLSVVRLLHAANGPLPMGIAWGAATVAVAHHGSAALSAFRPSRAAGSEPSRQRSSSSGSCRDHRGWGILTCQDYDVIIPVDFSGWSQFKSSCLARKMARLAINGIISDGMVPGTRT